MIIWERDLVERGHSVVVIRMTLKAIALMVFGESSTLQIF